jgi:hypothetical protein
LPIENKLNGSIIALLAASNTLISFSSQNKSSFIILWPIGKEWHKGNVSKKQIEAYAYL